MQKRAAIGLGHGETKGNRVLPKVAPLVPRHPRHHNSVSKISKSFISRTALIASNIFCICVTKRLEHRAYMKKESCTNGAEK